MGDLTEEEMEEFMQKKYEELENEEGIEVDFDDVDIRYDSDSPNFIHFRKKNDKTFLTSFKRKLQTQKKVLCSSDQTFDQE